MAGDGTTWKRVYVDIPPETHRLLAVRAAERGMTQKALVAELIESECRSRQKLATKRTRSKKVGSKKK
jgi:hypothetical protein